MFVQHVGLKRAWEFDREVAEKTRSDINPQKYEQLKSSQLF